MTTTVRNLYDVVRYDTAVYITTCQRYAWGYIPGQPGTFRWTPLGNPLKGDVRMSIYTAAAAAAFSFVLFVLFPFLSFFLSLLSSHPISILTLCTPCIHSACTRDAGAQAVAGCTVHAFRLPCGCWRDGAGTRVTQVGGEEG